MKVIQIQFYIIVGGFLLGLASACEQKPAELVDIIEKVITHYQDTTALHYTVAYSEGWLDEQPEFSMEAESFWKKGDQAFLYDAFVSSKAERIGLSHLKVINNEGQAIRFLDSTSLHESGIEGLQYATYHPLMQETHLLKDLFSQEVPSETVVDWDKKEAFFRYRISEQKAVSVAVNTENGHLKKLALLYQQEGRTYAKQWAFQEVAYDKQALADLREQVKKGDGIYGVL